MIGHSNNVAMEGLYQFGATFVNHPAVVVRKPLEALGQKLS